MTTPRFRRIALICTIVLSLIAASCGSDDAGTNGLGTDDAVTDDVGTDADPATSGPADGDGTSISPVGQWSLTSLTVAGAPAAVPADAELDLEIGAGVISAQGGCNTMRGSLEIGLDGTMAISESSITEMGCEASGVMDFESTYVGALVTAETWEVTPTGLVLRGADVELTYAIAAAPEPVSLEGTMWIFDTVFAGEGVNRTASTPRMDLAEATLSINEGVAVLQADDCGEVSFALGNDGGVDGGVRFDAAEQPVSPCAEAESNLSTALDGLLASDGFSIVDGRLTFIGFEGETVGFRVG